MEQRLKELLKERVKVHQAEQHMGKSISVAGWIVFVRFQKTRIFIKLSDSRKSKLAPLQVMFELTKETEEYFEDLKHVHIGCSLAIKGLIVLSPGKGQKIEMIGSEYRIIAKVEDPSSFPLSKSELTTDYLRTIEHLDCFVTKQAIIYSIRSELMSATEKFFELEEYTKCDMPLITFSECEGGCQPMQCTLLLTSGTIADIPITCLPTSETKEFATLSDRFQELDGSKPTLLVDFSKDFFGVKSSLTVSAQLELETQLPLGDVWTVTRAIRGEPSQTSRHLCEFSMIELEKQFSTGAEDIIDISTRYIKFCIKYVLDRCMDELLYLEIQHSKPIVADLTRYIAEEFAEITHAQAVELMLSLPEGKFKELPSYGADLGSEHEKFLTDEYFLKPVVVRKYPKVVKAFYMPVVHETPEESHGVEHVDCFDLLVPGVGELVGGSQRIDDAGVLMERIKELGLDPRPLDFYVDLRRKGSVSHGGMGCGFERLVSFITRAPSVKECVAFPRYIGSGRKTLVK